MSFELINPYQTFWDSTGKVRAGGKLTIFDNETTTKASIFSDEALTVAQTNPYTLNANGQIEGDVKYEGLKTLQVTNSDGSDVRTTDNVTTIGAQNQTENLSSVAGTNTITATATPTVTSLVDKTVFNLILANTNTGAVTLQVDATAAKSVLKYHDQPIIAGDWEANQAISVIYNGTDDVFELKTPTLNPQIQSITATVAASALTLGLNPTSMYFRKTPLTDGTPNVRSTAAISLVVPSGATLGTVDGVESKITEIAIDNAGTLELACINAISTVLDETGLITTLAIGTGSDSADVFYSTSARTSVPYRVVGFEDSTQSTAGTWDTSPTLIQGAGGGALNDHMLLQALPRLQTEIATTSGTTHDFTGIPAWVKNITLMFEGTGHDGSSDFLIQLGDSVGFEASGYLGSSAELTGTTVITNYTTGFGIAYATGHLFHGTVTIFLKDAANFTWIASGNVATTTSRHKVTAGSKSLSSALTQLRLTSVSADTFNAGSINIMWE